jgi:hypothetical protein
LIAEGLTISREYRSPHHVHYGIDHAAVLAAAAGQPERAARLAAARKASRERLHSVRHPIWKTMLRQAGVPLDRPAGDRPLASAWDRGRAMSLEEALADAMSDEPRAT